MTNEEIGQKFVEVIKNIIQTCEDADRPIIEKYAAETICPLMRGYASEICLWWDENRYENKVKAYFLYTGSGAPGGLASGYHYESKPPVSCKKLNREIFDTQVKPVIKQWLEEKVMNENFGGFYAGTFSTHIHLKHETKNWELEVDAEGERCAVGHYELDFYFSDPKRKETQREMIREFMLQKKYENYDFDSDEYHYSNNDILHTIPSFFGEFPNAELLTAIDAIGKEVAKDPWYLSIDFCSPLIGAGYGRLSKNSYGEATDENISEEELDLYCQIALRIMKYADDSHSRESATSILNMASEKGSPKAKDYLKFGSGTIDKSYTYLKTKKVEAIANDVVRTITFKVKEEDAESYGQMVDFIIALLAQGFPTDYQIKINTKLKYSIPVGGDTKTNYFWANAASFPELYGKLAEYVRKYADDYTYYSDAEDEQAVMVGGYAAFALGLADPDKNIDTVVYILEHSDFEHALTSREFLEEYVDKCSKESKAKIKEFLKEIN